jgi:hypothetical protein
MAKQHKVRLPDGIELGPVDLETLRSWYEAGTIKKDSMVLPIGSKKWVRLMDAAPIDRWQMPSPARHRSGARAAAAPAHASASETVPTQRWRTILAAALLMSAAGASAYLAFFPERWLASLRIAPWREIALGFLAMGLALVRGWELTRKLVRALLVALSFGLFPMAGIAWVEGVRNEGLVVLACAWVLGTGFFALLSRGRLTALACAASVLLVLSGAFGIGYFGVAWERPAAAAAAAAR